MSSIIPLPDSDFKTAFHTLSYRKDFSPYLREIILRIEKEEMNSQSLKEILDNHRISDIKDVKEETLNVLLSYIDLILVDGLITEKELANLKALKRLFKIREGDFYSLKRKEVRKMLNKQFEKILDDNIVNKEEAILKVGLQELFDLGYDQFSELSMEEVKKALDRGANLDDLDTVLKI